MAAPTPHVRLTIDRHSPSGGIQELMKTVRPDWTEIRTKTFSDGLTNDLFGVFERDESELILVRVFGLGSEKFIDRKRELQTLRILGQYGCVEPVHATFDNGMCYGFVQGQVLEVEMMRSVKYAEMIAKEMARLHTIPLSEEYAATTKNAVSVFQETRDMFKLLPKQLDDEASDALYRETVHVDQLARGLEELENLASTFDEKLVICHYDTMNRNLVYNPGENRVFIIDFEYAGPGLAAMDIGCHFPCYVGLENPDPEKYPSKEHQYQFLRFYLEERNKYLSEPVEVTDALVDLWYDRVNKMSLIFFLYWGVWAVLQSVENTHDFGFLQFGCLLLGHYMTVKDDMLSS